MREEVIDSLRVYHEGGDDREFLKYIMREEVIDSLRVYDEGVAD